MESFSNSQFLISRSGRKNRDSRFLILRNRPTSKQADGDGEHRTWATIISWLDLVFLAGRGPLLLSQTRTAKGLYSSLRPMPPLAVFHCPAISAVVFSLHVCLLPVDDGVDALHVVFPLADQLVGLLPALLDFLILCMWFDYSCSCIRSLCLPIYLILIFRD